MSYDPKVWTSEKPERNGKYWYCAPGFIAGIRGLDRASLMADGAVRSIHAIPSAAEIAALVECEQFVRLYFDPTRRTAQEAVSMLTAGERAALAALARLDAARKEQGE